MADHSRLPEVPLQWSEFMWSLERLKNKPYDKKMSERFVLLEVDYGMAIPTVKSVAVYY